MNPLTNKVTAQSPSFSGEAKVSPMASSRDKVISSIAIGIIGTLAAGFAAYAAIHGLQPGMLSGLAPHHLGMIVGGGALAIGGASGLAHYYRSQKKPPQDNFQKDVEAIENHVQKIIEEKYNVTTETDYEKDRFAIINNAFNLFSIMVNDSKYFIFSEKMDQTSAPKLNIFKDSDEAFSLYQEKTIEMSGQFQSLKPITRN